MKLNKVLAFIASGTLAVSLVLNSIAPQHAVPAEVIDSRLDKASTKDGSVGTISKDSQEQAIQLRQYGIADANTKRNLERRNVWFHFSMNISDVEDFKYADIIARLREEIRQRCPPPPEGLDNTAIVLPQQQRLTRGWGDEHWFEVELETSQGAVTFRLRNDNLYLDAYRVRGSSTWWEFQNERGVSLIDGSESLGFGGSYPNLEGQGATREGTSLGGPALVDAVNQLNRQTTLDAAERRQRAKSLLVVVQMLSESLRLNAFTAWLARYWIEYRAPEPQYLRLQNLWGTLSVNVQSDSMARHDGQDPGAAYFPVALNDQQRVKSAAAALTLVAIMLRIGGVQENSGSQRRAVPAGHGGQTLAEIVAVPVNDIDGENPGQLCGTIKATDALGVVDIFNRASGNAQEVGPHGAATLLETRALSGADDFSIAVDLMDHDTLSPDDEIAKGNVYWPAFDPTVSRDTIRRKQVRGQNGAVTVEYVVMNRAAEASISVVLINGDGEDPAQVYGKIFAQTRYRRYTLLDETEAREVRVQQAIPLVQRPIPVPVSVDDKLVLDFDLWDHDNISPDDQIAKGGVELQPQLFQSVARRVRGQNGAVELRLTWW
ncbi:hypothetical protein HIM_01265 [Hirsutella minnesotensis 3608]|nr:hypothetical protein HIM_01265 [Hirsutella minnesotensis 3608]